MLINCLLSLLYWYFATSHLVFAYNTGQWLTVIPIIMQETLLSILFAFRRSGTTSTHPWDWTIGIAGAFLPLCVRAVVQVGWIHDIGVGMQMVGAGLVIASLLSLNDSIGIVAANRGVKTGGMYRIVRHPVYSAHTIVLLGYWLASPTEYNAAIVAVTIALLYVRANAEERWLGEEHFTFEYGSYQQRVPWRFVPGVW